MRAAARIGRPRHPAGQTNISEEDDNASERGFRLRNDHRRHGGMALGREIEGYVGEKSRGVRSRAADALRIVEEKTGRVLDSSESSLRRAEGVVQETKERVSTALRAGQDAIRPAPTS